MSQLFERCQRLRGALQTGSRFRRFAGCARRRGMGLRHRLHKPSVKTVIDAIATDIAQVFREEYRVDRFDAGTARSTRHPKAGNKTLFLWADLDDPNAPHTHFVKIPRTATPADRR